MEPTSAPPNAGDPRQLETLSPQIAAGIKQLNVDPSNERFMKLVDDLLRPESLPRGWTADFDEESQSWRYKDKTGVLHDKHPVYDYYIGAMFMDMGGYAQLKRIAAERPPTAAEVEQMGLYLSIKKDEDKYIWQVAEMALCAPVPPGWEECVSEAEGTNVMEFKDQASGKLQQEHPLDNYFRELIRRRRKELLRRKKAALKSLQALVKMGMRARLSQITALTAAGKDAAKPDDDPAEDGECDDVESLDPAAQHQLLGAWQRLLGSAVQLVHFMQAAQWDGSIAMVNSSNSCSCSTNDANATEIRAQNGTVGLSDVAVSGAYAAVVGSRTEGAAGSTKPQLAAVQQRLSHIDTALRSALDPNAAVPDAAAAALQEIEALALHMQAAGDNPDALVRVLAAQGISLPECCAVSSSSNADARGVRLRDGASLGRQCNSTPISRRPSLQGAARASDSSKDTGKLPRASLLPSSQVDFVSVDTGNAAAVIDLAKAGSTTATSAEGSTSRTGCTADGTSSGSTIGTTSAAGTSGAADASRCNIEPNVTASAVSAPAKTSLFKKISTMWPSKDDARGSTNYRGSLISFIGANVGCSSNSGCVSEAGWSLSGGKPTVAGTAAAASVRALAALKQEHGIQFKAAITATATVDTSGLLEPSQKAEQSAITGTPANAQSTFVSSASLPMVTAALQHMSALQMILQEAASLICSWQQQKVVIALLQLWLRDAAVQAQDGQERLATALQQLDQIRADQAQNRGAASVASAEYEQLLQKFQDVQSELMGIQNEKQQLQEGSAHLQASIEAAVGAAAAAADKQQQLEQQLQKVQVQLEQDQAAKEEQQAKFEAVMAELELLRAEHAKLQASAGSDMAGTSAELSNLQLSHRELQSEHEKLQGTLAAAQAEAEAAQEQQQLLTLQLQQVQQQLQQLQVAFAALQMQFQQQGQQFIECQQALGQLQTEHKQQQEHLAAEQHQHQQLQQEHQQLKQQMTGAQQGTLQLQNQTQQQQEQLQQLQQQMIAEQQAAKQLQQRLEEKYHQQQEQTVTAQQQLQKVLHEKQQTEQQHQQLQVEKEKLLEQQLQLLDKQYEAQAKAKAAQKEIADMQAAAKAAEEQRLANPKHSTQVSATDAMEQHWVRSRGVQTGEELDPRHKKDVGTPADLSLISFFFRDIKAKQRGGGGAVIGYDPEGARAAAACAVPAGCAALWTGQPALPPISRDGSKELSMVKRRPATMPGSTRAPVRESLVMPPRLKKPEAEEETGRFNTRPAPWEVKSRVDRRRDRAMRLETDPLEGGAAGDRWDYSHDERDNEIAELKKRLVEEQRKTKEATARATEELSQVLEQLQVSKRSVEQLQADNFTLRKELDSHKLNIHASDVTAAYHEAARAVGTASSGTSGALRPSVFGGGLSGSKALGGRTSGIGSVSNPGSLGSSMWGSGPEGVGGSEGRSSIALLSLSGGAPAAGLPGLPTMAATGGVSSNSGGNGASRASVFAAGGRSSVVAAQSVYAAGAAGKGGPRLTSAGKT